MEFCPECGSMLLPTEDNELKCSCGYTKKLSKDKSEYNVNEKIKENDSVIEKGEGKKLVEKETGIPIFSVVKLDVIDGKVVIEKTIED